MTVVEALATSKALLPQGKLWLRRSSPALDDEIQQTTAACLLDLQNAGIKRISGDDPLICQAVKLYLRANIPFDEHPERWERAYELLKGALSLCGEYRSEGQVPGDV